MKSKIFLVLCIFFQFNATSQINYATLDHNNVAVHISDAGTYFVNLVNSTKGYEVPKGSGHHTIYTAQFWFAGKDTNNILHRSRGAYPGYGRDIYNGPVSNNYGSPAYQAAWSNSMWSICQSDIDQFKNWWACNSGMQTTGCDTVSSPSMEVMESIYSWPAHGDVSIGQSYFLAPFFDFNSDGNYNPDDGDYPIIKGCCATYMIQNDMAESHTYSDTDSIGIELHLMFYQYQTSDYLNDVTFIDVMAINQGNTDYPIFSQGILLDADIGYYGDDFFGCDTLTNTMYFYNSDNFDENNFGQTGYDLNPPAIGIVGLKNKFTTSAPFIIGTTGSMNENEWNVMNGLKNNGSPWLNPDSVETKFVFNGNPIDQSTWSEVSMNNLSGDRRGSSSTSIHSFHAGDTILQTYAILYARNGNNLENASSIIDLAADVKVFYDTQSHVQCSNGILNLTENDNSLFTIAPNPSSGQFTITSEEQNISSVKVFDAQGKMVKELKPTNPKIMNIDLSDQHKGFYILYINNEKVKSTFHKIIVE
jgi:hypothetical protein